MVTHAHGAGLKIAGLFNDAARAERAYQVCVERGHEIGDVNVVMSEGTRNQLEQTQRAKYGPDLTTEYKVTPALIGGLRVKIGSDVWDSSVRERLNRLEAQLATA